MRVSTCAALEAPHRLGREQTHLSLSPQNGPYLRTEEGDETAVLCNYDDVMDGACERSGPDFEVISSPGTPSLSSSPEATEMGVDDGTSRSAEPTQIVYSRDGVAVWPTRKDRILGRLRLLKQDSVLFLAWLPRSPGLLDDEGKLAQQRDASDVAATPKSQGKYAVHPTPLSELKAVRKETPKLGSHHALLILKNGSTLGPFHFTSGGVRSLFSILKQHAVLTKSDEHPGTYVVNDAEDPLQRSLATLDLPDIYIVDSQQLPALPNGQQGADAGNHLPLMDRMKEGVFKATLFARETTSSFLLPSKQQAAAAIKSEALSAKERKEKEKAETGVGLFEMVDRSESESMSSGLSHPCPPPLTQDEWFTFLDSSGRVVDSKAVRTRIFNGGVETSIRKEAWKYLLGLYPEGSTAAYRQTLSLKRNAEYLCIQAQWTSITDKQAARFGKWRERQMRVDKDVTRTDPGHPFFAGEDNPNVASLRRILLTYSMYNFDLGYCQGMSDLASPILFVMRDEATAFWCFANLMERMEPNFSTDCTGMHAQLKALASLMKLVDPELHAFFEARDCTNFFFCYRWLLVHFKREFSFDQALQMWEALWSCPLTPHFHIYVCAAVLRMHRKDILTAEMGFDDLLSFCIQLSGRLDLGRTLRCAERLFEAAGKAGVQCLRDADLQ